MTELAASKRCGAFLRDDEGETPATRSLGVALQVGHSNRWRSVADSTTCPC
jgi:hypothetical protein